METDMNPHGWYPLFEENKNRTVLLYDQNNYIVESVLSNNRSKFYCFNSFSFHLRNFLMQALKIVHRVNFLLSVMWFNHVFHKMDILDLKKDCITEKTHLSAEN